jgi:hypothetical protein
MTGVRGGRPELII